ncbi:hypothetical protein AMJ80_02250 [bacterium SM23_31]|nr:MAG: hypothetical protein AMJ80_02250 [bacterium SM23_31]
MDKIADKREIIISVAQKKFAQYGPRKTTIDEIANGAGISKGLIYHYFADKKDIYHAVIMKEIEQFESLLLEAVDKMDKPASKLTEYIRVKTNKMVETANFYRLNIQWLNEVTRDVIKVFIPEILEKMSDYRKKEINMVSKIIKEGMEQGDFKKIDTQKAAIFFINLFSFPEILLAIHEDYVDINEMIDFSLNIFFEGINTRT